MQPASVQNMKECHQSAWIYNSGQYMSKLTAGKVRDCDSVIWEGAFTLNDQNLDIKIDNKTPLLLHVCILCKVHFQFGAIIIIVVTIVFFQMYFCIKSWAWLHKHSHLNYLITEGLTSVWYNCSLFVLLFNIIID